jgi:hypothetical protein
LEDEKKFKKNIERIGWINPAVDGGFLHNDEEFVADLKQIWLR